MGWADMDRSGKTPQSGLHANFSEGCAGCRRTITQNGIAGFVCPAIGSVGNTRGC